MSLYTIGHAEVYRACWNKARLAGVAMYKSVGGFAWSSPEEAVAWLERNGGYNGNPPSAYVVFELADAPVALHPEGYPVLLESAVILGEVTD